LVARDFITVKLPIGGYSDADLNTPFNLDSPSYYTGRLYDPLTGLQVRNHLKHSEQSHTATHVTHAARHKATANAEVAAVKSVESVPETSSVVIEMKTVANVVQPGNEVRGSTIGFVKEIKRDISRAKEKPPRAIKSIPQQFVKKGITPSDPIVLESRNADGTLCVRKQQHRYNEDSMDMWDFDLHTSRNKHDSGFSSRTSSPTRKPLNQKYTMWKPTKDVSERGIRN
jgi:hypothetical protein